MEARKQKPQNAPWLLQDVLDERRAVQREVEILVNTKGEKNALPELLSRVADAAGQTDEPGEQLRCVFLVAEIIDLDPKGTELSESALKRITDLSRLILTRHKITPDHPEFGFLHGESYPGLAQRAFRSNPWETLSRLAARDMLPTASGPGNQATTIRSSVEEKILEAKSYMRLGAMERAVYLLANLERTASDARTLAWVRLHKIRCLRLENKSNMTETEVSARPNDSALTHDEKRAFEWEALMNAAQKKGSILGPLKETGRNRPLRKFRPVVLTWLWAHALQHTDFLKQIPSSRSIREMLPDDAAYDARDEWIPVVKAIETIESANIEDLMPAERAVQVSQVLADVTGIYDPEVRLFVTAACGRWFVRHGYISIAALVTSAYNSACLTMSQGQSADLYKILTDVMATEAAIVPEAGSGLVEKDFLWLARTMKLSSFAIGTTQTMVKSKIKQAFSAPSRRQKIVDREIEEHAARIRNYLRIAKGALLKSAQAVVFLDATLPEPIAREIRDLTSNIEPLDHTLSRKLLEQELGKPIEELFDDWNPYPVGAASIGQVHRARLKDGRDVAVKIQYPRMREILIDQQAAARFLSPVSKFFYPAVDVERAVTEMTEMLLEETDYRKEISYLQKAWDASQHIAGIRVPRPVHELSTEKIITMEYLEGSRFWEFVRGVNQEERNRVAAIIVKAHFEMRYIYGVTNFDPHPGNFVFGPGYVGLIDFGSASSDNTIMLDSFRLIFRTIRDGKKDQLKEALNSLGFIGDMSAFDLDAAWAQLANDFKPFIEDRPMKLNMDFVKLSLAEMAKNQKAWNLPPQWIGHFRSNLGIYTLLSALDAEINMHQLVGHLL